MKELTMIQVPAVPAGYEEDLSGYGPVLTDGMSSQPIGWGFVVRRHLGDERFGALRSYGEMECVDHRGGPGAWALIVKRLTFEEAVAKYGAVTKIDRGPRGGFRSITFGATCFLARQLDPGRDYRVGAS